MGTARIVQEDEINRYPEFITGFELELVSPFSRLSTNRRLNDYLVEKMGAPPDRNRWVTCTDDVSLSAGNNKSMHCVEVVTYPFDNTTSDALLKNCIGWMSEVGCKTNTSTGLHINISFKDKKLNNTINPLMMISLCNEEDIAEFFKREKNGYCVPWRRELQRLHRMCKKAFKSHLTWLGLTEYDYFILETENLFKLICGQTYPLIGNEKAPSQKIYKNLQVKYHSINFLKFAYNNYVEYRLAGGKDYHKDWVSLDQTIKHFREVLALSIYTDTEFIKEYLGKIVEESDS